MGNLLRHGVHDGLRGHDGACNCSFGVDGLAGRIRHTDTVEVILKDQRRRRWSPAEKAALVRRTYEPGMSVSLVARQEGVAASLLFQWRKLDRQGALTAVSAGEAVVPASELAAARAEIAKLQRVLGKKTLENEILKEAVEYAAEKKWIARSPLLPGDDQ